jgi:hypothetical protein
LYDHEIKDFKSVQIEGNLWPDGAVLVGRQGKHDISNLFAVIILFNAFLNEEYNVISCSYSSFGKQTRLRAGWPRNRDSIPGRARNYFLFYSVQAGSGDHPVSYSMGTRGTFPVIKAEGL